MFTSLNKRKLFYHILFFTIGQACVLSCSQPYSPSNRQIPHHGQSYTYSQASINYFKEIGFGSEYGNMTKIVHKWTIPVISISLQGEGVQTQDHRAVQNVINDLQPLTGLRFQMSQGKRAQINIHIIRQENFKKCRADYNINEPQDGMFFINTQNPGVISSCCIAIDHLSTRGNLKHRNHLIREEFTQCLGLFKDSYRYTNSIFHQDPQYIPITFSFIDKEVIRLLYDNKTKPGMNVAQFNNAYLSSSRQIAQNNPP